MTSTDNLGRRMADHYQSEAPPRAPDWLLTRTLDTIDTTPQRRTVFGQPWRIGSRPSLAKLATGAVAVVTIAAVGATVLRLPSVGPAATSSPSTQPSPSSSTPATPPPLTERFDSALNGISIDYPAGWQTRPATEPWTDGVIGFDAPGVDIIFDPTRGEDLYFALASEPSGGKRDDVWQQGLTLPPCPGGHSGGVSSFDGAQGWVVQCGGSFGTHSALLVTDTQGYAIVMHLGDEGLMDTYTHRWFRSVLETLDLRAGEAPGASTSP